MSRSFGVFQQALADHGWVEGHNLLIEARFADDQEERLPALATELAGLPVDVLVATGTQATLAASQASATLPIIFTTGGTPIAYGLAESYARPGRNVTGFTTLTAELTAKRLELLKQAVPTIARVAVFASDLRTPDEAQRAADALGIQIKWLPVSAHDDLDAGLRVAQEWGADAWLIESAPTFIAQGHALGDVALARSLPSMSGVVTYPGEGGLLAYGSRLWDNFPRAAAYVDKILRGAKPADLPIEQPREFDFIINLKTAQALGLTIPQHVLLQATEVIQ
jgi:putative ABC transport system substrate-binding protein